MDAGNTVVPSSMVPATRPLQPARTEQVRQGKRRQLGAASSMVLTSIVRFDLFSALNTDLTDEKWIFFRSIFISSKLEIFFDFNENAK